MAGISASKNAVMDTGNNISACVPTRTEAIAPMIDSINRPNALKARVNNRRRCLIHNPYSMVTDLRKINARMRATGQKIKINKMMAISAIG